MKDRLAIGIDLGATNIKGVLISSDGEIIQQVNYPIPEDVGQVQGDHWKNEVRNAIGVLRGKANRAVSVIGLAAPGIANSDNTAISHMPGRLLGLENFIWQNFLEEDHVPVLNDAHAALMGEIGFGVGQGYQNVVMLTLGTGVGGAIFINGELYQGNNQMAGHLGHISVDSHGAAAITKVPGSLEDAVGSASVSRRTYGHFNSVQDLAKAYSLGDTLGTYFWLNSVRDLAVGISALTNAISPELVILGGGIANADDALFKPLTEFLNIYEWAPGGNKIKIRKAKFQEYAGAIGAASFGLVKNP